MKPAIKPSIATVVAVCCVTGIFFGLAGCTSPPPMIQEPVKRYFEVAASLDAVWKTSVQALVEKGVIISMIDKQDNLIVVEEMLDGAAFQRTTAEKAYFYSGLARVSLLFTDKGEQGTGININAVLQGFTGRYNFYVTSNGSLEKDYFLLIQNNLPVRKTYKWLEDSNENAGSETFKEDSENRGQGKQP